MKKKRHVPAPQRSAFEDARAALERAGEDPSELKKTPVETAPTPDSAETSAPVENAQASEPETADSAAPETVTAETAEASAPETADDAETPVPAFNAQAQEVEDSAEASETASDAETESEASETAENAEASEPEASDGAETPVSETADGAEAGSASETDEPESAENIAATPETDAEPSDASEPEAADGGAAPESDDDTKAYPLATEASDADEEASEPLPDEEDASEDGGDVWEYADEPESEIAETERHMMETREITVGYHPIRTADASEHSGAEAAKSKKKPRFKALDALKDAFQSHAEQEQEEQGDDSPPAGSSRDAALRKRVMQIEDDETRNYLLDRVLPQMTWYSKRSAQYRSMYYRLMAATIFLGALIPVFSVGGSYGVVKVIIALLGASVTAINAYIALHNYHDLWITYQKTREDLVHTLYCYFNRAGVFSQKRMSEKDVNVLLVNVCEDTLSKENGGWTTIVQMQTMNGGSM